MKLWIPIQGLNHAKFQFFSRSKPWKTSNFKARIRQAFSRGSWKNQGLNIFIFWESFKGKPWETLKFKVFSRWKLEKTWTSSQGLGQDFQGLYYIFKGWKVEKIKVFFQGGTSKILDFSRQGWEKIFKEFYHPIWHPEPLKVNLRDVYQLILLKCTKNYLFCL